jgi:hypothetical protein
MFERLWSWGCTYLLGVSFPCFRWNCYRERLTVETVFVR